ncbi:glycosyltransferase family 39 protein [Leptolyngbya sp. PCC 6406]|uniref:glycosyltransferase family 39 protein n=1 Tax=Leptolyngbya sp. PCC 6406 TaxID=1173264 RepID=UPI0002ACD7C2|nr:glycosyltransferase family 39 protein [Leptolyngbya sp. PCC 6406]
MVIVSDRPLAIAIGLAILLGVILRCWGLDHKLFWVDEVYTQFNIGGYTNGEVATLFHPPHLTTAEDLLEEIALKPNRGLGAMVHSLITEDTTHVPLYYALTHLWVRVFGSSVSALRSTAVLFSLLALPSFYALALGLFRSRLRAGLAVALMAVSPFHGLYAQEARPYSLWLLLTVLSSALLVQSLHRRRWQDWGLYGLSASLGLYTFLYMPLVLLAQCLYVLGLEWGRWTLTLRRYWVAAIAAAISFLPWLVAIAPYRANLTGNTRWQVQSASTSPWELLHNLGLTLTRGFIDFDWNYNFSLGNWWPYGLVVLATVALVGYSFGLSIRHSPRQSWLLPLLLFLVPLAAIAVLEIAIGQQQSGIPRYFTPCYVGAELAVAYSLGHWLEGASRRLGILVATAILAIGALSYGNNAIAPTWWHKSGHYIPVVAQIIGARDRPLVLLDSDAWSFALAHRLPPTTALIPFNSTLGMPAVPPGYSDYFLAYPPADWMAEYGAASGYTLTPLENLENVPIWSLTVE